MFVAYFLAGTTIGILMGAILMLHIGVKLTDAQCEVRRIKAKPIGGAN